MHTLHLLLGPVAADDPTGRALIGLGLDEMAVRRELAGARVISLGGSEIDTEALAAIGVDYEAVRAAVERRFGAGALNVTLTRKPPRRAWFRRRRHSVRFSGEARRALERSLRIAVARGDKEIAPLHVLLGVLADPFCIAVRMIERRGLTVEELRAAL